LAGLPVLTLGGDHQPAVDGDQLYW